MSEITATIQNILEADGTLETALTGGIYIDVADINRQDTPGAFDGNGEIMPCCLIKTGNENTRENVIRAVTTPLVIYIYQRRNYDQIDIALEQIHALLEMYHTTGVWQIRFDSEIARAWDDALSCSLAIQRFNVIQKKGE